MARYNCRSCGFEGEAKWDGRLGCPRCNDTMKVGVAIAGWELAEVKLSVPEVVVPDVQQRAKRKLGGDRVIRPLSESRLPSQHWQSQTRGHVSRKRWNTHPATAGWPDPECSAALSRRSRIARRFTKTATFHV